MLSHAAVLKARYIWGFKGPYLASQGAIWNPTTRVYISPIDVKWPMIIDRIIYQVGATSAGNVRLGIYREGATADSPAGAALVVESASVAQSTASFLQMVTVADTLLTPGQYFIGIQGDDVTGTMYLVAGGDSLIAWRYISGGYGAFTNPCPALTAVTYIPLFGLRVKQNLPAGGRVIQL